MTKMEMFRAWLKDAYAMEYGASDLLTRYSKDAERYPDVRDMFTDAADKADRKAERLRVIIEGMGDDVSAGKNALGKLASLWQSGMSELMHDQVVKHMLAAYSGAHLAAASYVSLAAAARELGHEDVAGFADESAAAGREEARRLEERLPGLTAEFLRLEHTDA